MKQHLLPGHLLSTGQADCWLRCSLAWNPVFDDRRRAQFDVFDLIGWNVETRWVPFWSPKWRVKLHHWKGHLINLKKTPNKKVTVPGKKEPAVLDVDSKTPQKRRKKNFLESPNRLGSSWWMTILLRHEPRPHTPTARRLPQRCENLRKDDSLNTGHSHARWAPTTYDRYKWSYGPLINGFVNGL